MKSTLPPAAADKKTKNPYTDSRNAWADRNGDSINSAWHWRVVAYFMMAITAFCVVGLVHQLQQNRFIPYVVEVDRLGTAAASGPASAATRADTRIIRAELGNWVSNVRTVFVDAAAQRAIINSGYAKIARDQPAYRALNEHFQANEPFKRAEKESITVEVKTVLPVGGNTWRVEWIETTRGRNGEVQKADEWQASITIIISPPSDENQILRNPLGIYVTDFSWTKRSTN